MKHIINIMIILVTAVCAEAQIINWSSMTPEQKHVATINVNWDYAATLGLGYAYRMETKLPAILNAQLSLPAGNDLLDDFKTKLGFQVRVLKTGNFQGTVAVFGIYRQFQSNLAKFQNFGGEFSGTFGYYRARWFAATEIGFDKAIVTHVKNSDLMRQNYPGVRDGWYIPTGGNFSFSLVTGYSFRSIDLYLKAGKLIDQNFNSTETIPFTFQFGINKRF